MNALYSELSLVTRRIVAQVNVCFWDRAEIRFPRQSLGPLVSSQQVRGADPSPHDHPDHESLRSEYEYFNGEYGTVRHETETVRSTRRTHLVAELLTVTCEHPGPHQSGHAMPLRCGNMRCDAPQTVTHADGPHGDAEGDVSSLPPRAVLPAPLPAPLASMEDAAQVRFQCFRWKISVLVGLNK
jgi:hypothetical protein